jgi:hypothetical protein
MTRLQPEAQIQRAVIEHLRRRGVAGSFAFHPANGGWRTAIEGAILKGMGVAAGVPDVIIISGGKVFGLELKVNNGRLTDIQRETIEAMQRAGAICGVAISIDEALRWLEQHGLLRGSISTTKSPKRM